MLNMLNTHKQTNTHYILYPNEKKDGISFEKLTYIPVVIYIFHPMDESINFPCGLLA
jgi:hypothetical protein